MNKNKRINGNIYWISLILIHLFPHIYDKFIKLFLIYQYIDFNIPYGYKR